jgi:SNF family Na+-dependent transporter
VWLAAAGQIFFTLSIGNGSIHTYASYVGEDDDVVLTGLTTSATNEFAEVILGGSIAIPVAVAFFGLAETKVIAAAGSFDLGFDAMPIIFQKMGALGPLYGTLWFALLFFAGITSSVALAQPAIAFFQDELGLTRARAVAATGGLMLIGGLPCVFFLGHGFLDEMDFWAGTFFLVVLAVVEVVLFAWVFGMKRGWEEITRGGDIRLPRLFRWVITYVTPVYLIVLLMAWFVRDAMPVMRLSGHPAADHPYLWGARALMAAVLVLFLVLVRVAWRRRRQRGEVEP